MNLSSSSGTVRKRYPSFEELDALKSELEKAKMELVKKEAECLKAENAAKQAEETVTKMQYSMRYRLSCCLFLRFIYVCDSSVHIQTQEVRFQSKEIKVRLHVCFGSAFL